MISQLILSKRLYICGSDYVEKSDPISAGMAISLFQDSVEILCWCILKELDARVKDNDSFTSFFDLVEKAPKNTDSKQLPFKARMLELNKARVNFKHYGNLPDISEARKFEGYTEEFLRVSFKDFFGIDFDSLTLTQLIPFNDIKDIVASSEKALAADNIKDCICELSKAKTLLFGKYAMYLPEVDRHLKDADRIIAKSVNIQGSLRIFEYLTQYLNALRNLNFVALCGVSMKDYLLMEQKLPHSSQTMSGKWHYSLKGRDVSRDEAEKMISILINLSLKLSQIVS